MMARSGGLIVLLVALAAVAGCIGADEAIDPAQANESESVDYEPPQREQNIDLVEFSQLVDVSANDAEIHVRVVMPADVDEAPVVAEFTPYNAPGRAMLIEPMLNDPSHYYVNQFVERGFAFAFADVRGTADSSGCMDLRGSMDIQDADELTEWLGTQDWSTGDVGFIGASYPGSEAHIAAIADNEHLGGVIPVVASTSFYDWHHKNGVPYSHHPNAFYNDRALQPTLNPQYENWATKYADEAECDRYEHVLRGQDGTGTYGAWWADRDLNHRVDEVDVPVLMAHGLADWNVKPDHIDPYFNELDTDKTLVAPQMPHSFPGEAEDAYGDWWELAAAFFDETLNGADTGLFDKNLAYVQDDTETWHTYEDEWPPEDPPTITINVTDTGLTTDQAPAGSVSWMAPPEGDDRLTEENTEVVLESEPLEEDLHVSGTPELNLTVVTEEEHVHLVAVVEVGSQGTFARENYGYLNPTYRHGLDSPQAVVPGQPTPVTMDMYPQEDIFEAGEKIRLTLSSTDGGRTMESYEPGEIQALFDGERPAQLEIPLSPLEH